MPLEIQVFRNGKPRKDINWRSFEGEAYLNGSLTAAVAETQPDLQWNRSGTVAEFDEREMLLDWVLTGIYYVDTTCPLWKEGKYTLKNAHAYAAGAVTFLAGDEIKMRRV